MCDFQQCGILTSVDSDEPVQNAPFSIIFSKVFKTLHKCFLFFPQCYLKIENDVMI